MGEKMEDLEPFHPDRMASRILGMGDVLSYFNRTYSIPHFKNRYIILLVVDAMTGQDAVTVAESFDTQLGVDGIILTKLDGDARGGAALSV